MWSCVATASPQHGGAVTHEQTETRFAAHLLMRRRSASVKSLLLMSPRKLIGRPTFFFSLPTGSALTPSAPETPRLSLPLVGSMPRSRST